MPKATDFKPSDKTINSFFKGFTRSPLQSNLSTPALQSSRSTYGGRAQNNKQAANDIDFDSLDDNTKVGYAIAAQRFDFSRNLNPAEWAKYMAQKYPQLSELEQPMTQAAAELKVRGNTVPWWSAARDFNLELFRGGDAGQMFKLNPNVVAVAQPNKAKDSSVEMGVGEGIDFEQMSDTDKMCFYIACTQYDGRANPEQWASYWAEKEGLPYTNLLKPAMFIHNIVAKEGVQSMKWVTDAEQKYPWIAAAKAYDPQQYRGYSSGQISGMLNGVMDKY